MDYTIQAGDTLTKIAHSHNTTVAKLMQLNPQITDKNLIFAGKTLKLNEDAPYSGTAVEKKEEAPVQNTQTETKPEKEKSTDAVANAGEYVGSNTKDFATSLIKNSPIGLEARFRFGFIKGLYNSFLG